MGWTPRLMRFLASGAHEASPGRGYRRGYGRCGHSTSCVFSRTCGKCEADLSLFTLDMQTRVTNLRIPTRALTIVACIGWSLFLLLLGAAAGKWAYQRAAPRDLVIDRTESGSNLMHGTDRRIGYQQHIHGSGLRWFKGNKALAGPAPNNATVELRFSSVFTDAEACIVIRPQQHTFALEVEGQPKVVQESPVGREQINRMLATLGLAPDDAITTDLGDLLHEYLWWFRQTRFDEHGGADALYSNTLADWALRNSSVPQRFFIANSGPARFSDEVPGWFNMLLTVFAACLWAIGCLVIIRRAHWSHAGVFRHACHDHQAL